MLLTGTRNDAGDRTDTNGGPHVVEAECHATWPPGISIDIVERNAGRVIGWIAGRVTGGSSVRRCGSPLLQAGGHDRTIGAARHEEQAQGRRSRGTHGGTSLRARHDATVDRISTRRAARPRIEPCGNTQVRSPRRPSPGPPAETSDEPWFTSGTPPPCFGFNRCVMQLAAHARGPTLVRAMCRVMVWSATRGPGGSRC
jgi:hypothetical protein